MTRKLTHKEAVAIGSKGGKSGKGKAKARDPEKMRKAALKRWGKHEPTHEELMANYKLHQHKMRLAAEAIKAKK